MKQKIFIAFYTTGVVLAVGLLYLVVTTLKSNPVTPLSPEEKADIALAQYAERPNSTTTYGTSHIPVLLSDFLFPNTNDPLVPGCSLRFSFSPVSKTVEPGGTIDYAITLTNRGKDTCQNVSLSDYYSSEESFVASNPKPTASDYYWAVGNLGSGQEYKISLTTKTSTQDGGTMNAESCATADNSPDVCAQNVIFVQSGASQTGALKSASHLNIPALLGSVWGTLFNKKEFGIWVWDSPLKMSQAYAQQVIAVAKQNGFNVIYLTIDDYLPISQLKDSQAKQSQTQSYMKALATFVEAANSAGIQVDAVAGAKDWSEPDNRWKGYTVIDFVQAYDAAYPNAKVRNFQYDVEPYLLPNYDGDKLTVLKQYVEFIDESAKRMEQVPSGFAIVIPHFYDKEQNWTPSFTYDGENAYTFTHLLHVLAQKNNTEILIMAYRNFFDGENGVKQVSEAELQEASNGSSSTKIVVAQETGDVPPAYVTFHEYPKSSLFDQLSEIQKSFGSYKNFGGTAVHYFDSFMKLK